MDSLAKSIAGLALLGTLSCRNVTPPGAFFASDPPGAQVIVDGTPSSSVTPCILNLDNDERHQVRLELAGYEPRELVLTPATRRDVIPWSDAELSNNAETLPLWLTFDELFLPIRTDESLAPSRVFVRLRPALGE